jgi:hypothetical protein
MTSLEDLIEHKAQVTAHIQRMHSFETQIREMRNSPHMILSRKMSQLQYWLGVLRGMEGIDYETIDPDFVRLLRANIRLFLRYTPFLLSCEDCRERWTRFLKDLDDGSDGCATCAAHAQ